MSARILKSEHAHFSVQQHSKSNRITYNTLLHNTQSLTGQLSKHYRTTVKALLDNYQNPTAQQSKYCGIKRAQHQNRYKRGISVLRLFIQIRIVRLDYVHRTNHIEHCVAENHRDYAYDGTNLEHLVLLYQIGRERKCIWRCRDWEKHS